MMRFQTSRSLYVLMYLALMVFTEADERVCFHQKILYKPVGQSVLLNMFHDFTKVDEIRWHWWKIGTSQIMRIRNNRTEKIVVKNLRNASLMLENVNKDYSGTYRISIEGRINNTYSVRETCIPLIVQDPIESISLDISPFEVTEGQTVKFTCVVNNGSDIKTILQRNHQKFNMTREVNDSRKFTFSKEADKRDDGVYNCIASNEISKGNDTKKLNVYYGPTTVEVNVTFPIKIREGENISIPCFADSNPPSDIRWTRYQEKISHGVLKINNSKDNSGPYTCVATNNKTNIIKMKTVNITIFRHPTHVPICSATLHNVTHVQLICVWENWKDTPQLKWSSSNGNYVKREKVSLYVKKDDANTGDVYTCNGKNNSGEQKSCHLYSPTANMFGETQVSPGGRIFLQCESTAIPNPTVTFVIKESSASRINEVHYHKQQSIAIYNAPRCSTFHIKCTATNILGESSRETRVEVKCLKSMERGIIILVVVCLVLGVCLVFLIPKIKKIYAQKKSWNKANGSRPNKYTTRNALRTCIMNDPSTVPFNQALRRLESDNYEQIEFLSSSQHESDYTFPDACADYAVVQRNKQLSAKDDEKSPDSDYTFAGPTAEYAQIRMSITKDGKEDDLCVFDNSNDDTLNYCSLEKPDINDGNESVLHGETRIEYAQISHFANP